MAKRLALGFFLDNMMKDITKNMNEENKSKIENDVDDKLIKVLGSDWSKLPITGSRMMVLVLILNIVLVPFGIVPAVLFEIAYKKAKENELDTKFISLIENVQDSTGINQEKINELTLYAAEAGENVKQKLNNLTESTKIGVKSIFEKGKGLLSKIRPNK